MVDKKLVMFVPTSASRKFVLLIPKSLRKKYNGVYIRGVELMQGRKTFYPLIDSLSTVYHYQRFAMYDALNTIAYKKICSHHAAQHNNEYRYTSICNVQMKNGVVHSFKDVPTIAVSCYNKQNIMQKITVRFMWFYKGRLGRKNGPAVITFSLMPHLYDYVEEWYTYYFWQNKLHRKIGPALIGRSHSHGVSVEYARKGLIDLRVYVRRILSKKRCEIHKTHSRKLNASLYASVMLYDTFSFISHEISQHERFYTHSFRAFIKNMNIFHGMDQHKTQNWAVTLSHSLVENYLPSLGYKE